MTPRLQAEFDAAKRLMALIAGDVNDDDDDVKADMVEGHTEQHDFGAGRTPGEFVFVPRDGGTAETDGWYMGLVIDTAAETTSRPPRRR